MKNALKATGRGILTGATVVLNASTNVRIREIDAEIKKLQEERDRLSKSLI